MKSTTKRILFILVSLAFLLGAVAVYSTLIRSAYENVTLLRGELLSKQENLLRYQNTVQRVSQLLGQFQNAGQVQNQVSLVLPNSPRVGYFANQLVGLSRINGLGLNSFSTTINPIIPSRSSVVSNVGSITGEATLSGTYAGFKSLLKQLENNMLLMDVGEFRMERPSGTGTALEYSVTLRSYYQTQ